MVVIELCREEKSFQITGVWCRAVKTNVCPIQFGLSASYWFPVILYRRILGHVAPSSDKHLILPSDLRKTRLRVLDRRNVPATGEPNGAKNQLETSHFHFGWFLVA